MEILHYGVKNYYGLITFWHRALVQSYYIWMGSTNGMILKQNKIDTALLFLILCCGVENMMDISQFSVEIYKGDITVWCEAIYGRYYSKVSNNIR